MWSVKQQYRTALVWQVGLAGYMQLVWLGLQLWTWRPPYLFGASEHWSQVYARAFARSTPILPRWANHLPPDALHFVLQLLLSGSVATGTMAVLRQPHGTRSSRPLQPTSGAQPADSTERSSTARS